MQPRKTGTVTEQSVSSVKGVNQLIEIYNHYYVLNRNQMLIGEYLGSGVMYVTAPLIVNLLERINLGNLISVTADIEWLTCSIATTKTFKYDPFPKDLRLPTIDDDVVTNITIIELLNDLLVIAITSEREKFK